MTQNPWPVSPSCKPISLIMDDREPCDLMKLEFERCGNFDVQIRHLSVGDYRVGESLLAERKTATDLVRSIIDGRLFGQTLRLAEAGLPAVLIVEGEDAELHGSGMSWESIQGALVNVSLFAGLPVLRSRTPQETVKTLFYAANQRRMVETDTLTRHSRRPKRKAALQSYILQGLPGVGPRRAKQLIEFLGSVQAVMGASEATLARIPGLGPDTIRRIRDAVS